MYIRRRAHWTISQKYSIRCWKKNQQLKQAVICGQQHYSLVDGKHQQSSLDTYYSLIVHTSFHGWLIDKCRVESSDDGRSSLLKSSWNNLHSKSTSCSVCTRLEKNLLHITIILKPHAMLVRDGKVKSLETHASSVFILWRFSTRESVY